MKALFFSLFILISIPGFAQEISTMDFVKTVDENREELIYYYENNWKVLRDIALEKGYIESYELMTILEGSTSGFDVILVTRYKNEDEFNKAEERFQAIIEEVQKSGGLKLLNDLKPGEFRSLEFYATTKTMFSPDSK